MKPWKRLAESEEYKVGYRKVVEKHFELPNGMKVDRTIMNQDGWAAACAIAITTDNKVIVARQFRPGPEKIFDELPGGIVDPGETPEQCVIRELAEETGFEPGSVEYLGAYYYDAYTNGDRHYFLLTDCKPTETGRQPEPDEDIELRLITIPELLDIAKKAGTTDVGGIMMAYDKLVIMMKENN
jgi:ADP-ribose pyrophosphatase